MVRYSKAPGSTGAYLVSRRGAEKFAAETPRSLPIDQDLKRVWIWGLDMYGVMPAPVRRDVFEASSIDAMTDAGWRTKRWRVARLRRNRAAETFSRHVQGVRDFGWLRWVSAEWANARVALAPRPQRERLLAQAALRLMRRA